MSEQLPKVGSVWGCPSAENSCDWRRVTCVDIGDCNSPPTVTWENFRRNGVSFDQLPDWDEWVQNAPGAIDITATLQPPKPVGETVRVRVAVGRDLATGKHYAYGNGIVEQLVSCDYEPVCFIEADIPARTLPTVEAAVVEGGRG